jgi:monofunctional biosynthetic peptidoglycan transglycosylase
MGAKSDPSAEPGATPHGDMTESPHAETIPPESRFRKWLRRAAMGLLAAVVLFHLWILAQLIWWRTHNPGTTAFMEQGLERMQEKNPRAQLRHRWVPYARISVHLKRAVIAAEDQKFLEHEGFDWEAIEDAYERNQARQRVTRGGSTISQQLAKNLFLSARRTYARKAEEAIITLMIELLWSKQRILEVYLNVIEWGNGIYGAEAAAQHYFGVSAAQLTSEQAARLTAMIPNPRYFDRRRDSPYLERRTQTLLRYMPMMSVP